ncbi:PfkB family carbohydrate kinase [Thermosipho melanesiensis]|uniref:PfkB family carbohydrate kinase n=1 Tax=Thermosipho melanesiensis TaxID=46541 RepID=UPI0027DA2C02|nr:PfkB family carbohydrate kinase [Thermosipho melanesiensis]
MKIPAFKVRAVDTNAACGVFNGVFSVALDEKFDIEFSLKFATEAAALAVTKNEVEKF